MRTDPVRYRWGWPHVPDSPEIVAPSLRMLLGTYVLIAAVFAIPAVREATGISYGAALAILGTHGCWGLFALPVLAPRAHHSRRAFDALVLGNVIIGAGLATSFPVLADSPASVLWCALVLYATMNGSISDFEPSIALQLLHAGIALASIPVFLARDHGAWAVAGPALAAVFAAVGYHRTASFTAMGRAHRRAVEAKLAQAERVAAELRLARDLHDVVGSALGTVKVYADLLAGSSPSLAAPLSDVAQGGLDDLRAVIDGLAPPGDGGVREAVEAVTRRVAPPGVAVAIGGTWPRELAGPMRVAIARIVQEATYNAIRHGGARRIEVACASDDDVVELHVRDDGAGFVRADITPGRGLAAMEARTRELGGSVAIDAHPGAGTTVRAVFPREHRRSAA